MLLTWIFRHPRIFFALVATATLAAINGVAGLASRDADKEREVVLAKELAGYEATLEGGTGSSRVMGALILLLGLYMLYLGF